MSTKSNVSNQTKRKSSSRQDESDLVLKKMKSAEEPGESIEEDCFQPIITAVYSLTSEYDLKFRDTQGGDNAGGTDPKKGVKDSVLEVETKSVENSMILDLKKQIVGLEAILENKTKDLTEQLGYADQMKEKIKTLIESVEEQEQKNSALESELKLEKSKNKRLEESVLKKDKEFEKLLVKLDCSKDREFVLQERYEDKLRKAHNNSEAKIGELETNLKMLGEVYNNLLDDCAEENKNREKLRQELADQTEELEGLKTVNQCLMNYFNELAQSIEDININA